MFALSPLAVALSVSLVVNFILVLCCIWLYLRGRRPFVAAISSLLAGGIACIPVIPDSLAAYLVLGGIVALGVVAFSIFAWKERTDVCAILHDKEARERFFGHLTVLRHSLQGERKPSTDVLAQRTGLSKEAVVALLTFLFQEFQDRRDERA